MTERSIRALSLPVWLFSVVLAVPASAQQIEEVVVTAQKREESLQDVGVSISAFTGEEIHDYGMNNAWDLAKTTPNFQVTSFYENSRPEIVIRGVGQNNTFGSIDQSPTGVYNDEVYVGARAAMLTQMFDLERVEVLRGPQGTLYGRNTTGGAINFISRKPSFEGSGLSGAATYGRFDQIEGELAGGMALSDTLAFRGAGIYRTDDGFSKNEFDGSSMSDLESWAGRLMLAWRPTANAELLFRLHGSTAESSLAIHHIGFGDNEPNMLYPVFGGPAYQENPDFHTLSNDRPGFEDNEVWGASIHADIEWSDIAFTTIVSYDEVDTAIREDGDGTPIDWFTIDYNDQFDSWSVEQRAASQIKDGLLGGLDWVLGFYYYSDEVNTANVTRIGVEPFLSFPIFGGPGGLVGTSAYTQESHNWALFGDAQYPVTDSIQLNMGLRYSFEEKDFDWLLGQTVGGFVIPPARTIANEDWDSFTGRLGAEWSPTEDMLWYLSFSKGFKSGGFNGVALTFPLPSLPDLTFDPEFNEAVELGLKSSWFHNRLTLNAALFHNRLTDQQILIVLPGNIFTVRNVAESTIKGVEFDAHFQPTDAFNIRATLGLMDAEFDEFTDPGSGRDLSGNPLSAAPDVSFNGLVEYVFATPALAGGTITPRFEWSYSDDQNFDRYGDNRIDSGFGFPIPEAVDVQEEYWVLNASLTWRSANERYSVQGWVHNLADEEYFFKTIGNFADSGSGGGATGYAAPPRTYGVTFRFSYE